MSSTAKYYLMKRCLECFQMQELDNKSCSQCGALFIGESTREEKDVANEKLVRMNEIRNNGVKGHEED